jgi:uncharacterized protein
MKVSCTLSCAFLKLLSRLLFLPLCIFLMAAEVAPPEKVGLYEAAYIVSGRGEANRAIGLRQCLKIVLAKVSGNPALYDDSRVERLADQASSHIESFRYRDLYEGRKLNDEQGSYDRPHYLTVAFSKDGIGSLLSQLGETAWQGERPAINIELAVSTKTGEFMLSETAEENRADDMRSSLTNAIMQTGLDAALPSDSQSSVDIVLEKLGDGKLAADAGDGKALLIGLLIWRNDLGSWEVAWRLRHQEVDMKLGQQGITFDDAFRLGMRGSLAALSGRDWPLAAKR